MEMIRRLSWKMLMMGRNVLCVRPVKRNKCPFIWMYPIQCKMVVADFLAGSKYYNIYDFVVCRSLPFDFIFFSLCLAGGASSCMFLLSLLFIIIYFSNCLRFISFRFVSSALRSTPRWIDLDSHTLTVPMLATILFRRLYNWWRAHCVLWIA